MTDIFSHAAAYIDDDGAAIYRASSLGHCMGALVRARLGVTGSAPPDAMQAKFDEGHDWEERVILAGLGVDWLPLDARALKEYGTVVEDPATGNVQVETEIRWGTPEAEGGRGVKVIRCHPDGVARHATRYARATAGATERRVVEAKFFGTDLFYATVKGVSDAEKEHGAELQARGLGFAYAMQLAVEMHSTGLPALYVIGLKERAGEIDVKQGRATEAGELMLGEVWTMEVDTPPFTLAEVKARVLEAEGWVTRGEMPPCVVPFDYPCAFFSDHAVVDKDEEQDSHLIALLAHYREAKEALDKDSEFVNHVRSMIQDRLTELHLDVARCSGFDLVRVAEGKGSISWASWAKEVRKKHPEIAVDEDLFRGKPKDAHLRITEVTSEKDHTD